MSKGIFDTHVMLSRPVGVVWAGWESNTHRLQQAGWQLAVDYDVHTDNYRLMIHSQQGQLYGLSRATYLDKRLAEAWNEDLPEAFHMQGLARSIEVIREHYMGSDSAFANFQQIDATPQYVQRKIERIEDFNIFKTVTTRAEEIFIEKADMTVLDHLQAIKELQSETQEEIRNRILDDRARAENAEPSGEIHSNIILLRPSA